MPFDLTCPNSLTLCLIYHAPCAIPDVVILLYPRHLRLAFFRMRLNFIICISLSESIEEDTALMTYSLLVISFFTQVECLPRYCVYGYHQYSLHADSILGVFALSRATRACSGPRCLFCLSKLAS